MGDENKNRNTLRFSSVLANVAEKNQVGKTGQVEQVFKIIQSMVSADIVKKTNAMYAFRFKLGDEYTNWYLDLKNRPPHSKEFTGSAGKG